VAILELLPLGSTEGYIWAISVGSGGIRPHVGTAAPGWQESSSALESESSKWQRIL